jgi:hypothetical protein
MKKKILALSVLMLLLGIAFIPVGSCIKITEISNSKEDVNNGPNTDTWAFAIIMGNIDITEVKNAQKGLCFNLDISGIPHENTPQTIGFFVGRLIQKYYGDGDKEIRITAKTVINMPNVEVGKTAYFYAFAFSVNIEFLD